MMMELIIELNKLMDNNKINEWIINKSMEW